MECYDCGDWEESPFGVNDIAGKDIIILPWKPQKGEKYYFVNAWTKEGYSCIRNRSINDDLYLSRREVYQTEEEAKEAVKKLGWKVD